jgi:hypothetical protein
MIVAVGEYASIILQERLMIIVAVGEYASIMTM